jgi:antitoxin component YwqK of YwqJK toxin-antitoxin module
MFKSILSIFSSDKDPEEEKEYWGNGKIKRKIRHYKSSNEKEIFTYLETGAGEEIIVRDSQPLHGAWGSEDTYSFWGSEDNYSLDDNLKIKKLVTYYETGERKTITLFKNGKINELIKFEKSGEVEGSHERKI